jgi:phosphomannomutase/phosphoglucomutase
MNANIFRKYDIRGIADRDLPDDVVYLIGRAFASFMIKQTGVKNPSVVVGRDIRPSSLRMRNAMSKALVESGVNVIDIGVVTTPITYFSIVNLNTTAGVMITGSHNPADQNGIKPCIGRNSVYGDDIQKLRQMIEAKDFVNGQGSESTKEMISVYQDDLNKKFKFSRKLRVVVDSGNGTAGLVAPKLMHDLGLEVIELFSEPDSRFPNHHPDPTVEKNVADLIKTVKEKKADVGLAFDGDADRIGVIDNEGNIIWGDKLLILFSRFILEQKPGAKFIADVKCSRTFFEDVAKHGGKAIMWKTGHALIKQKLKDEQADLAGEMSGHMFFVNRYYGFDDAVYAGLRVLEILDKKNKKLTELLSDVPKTFATPELRVQSSDERKFDIVDKVGRYFEKRYPTVTIDGARVDFGDGWGLLRASNTEPVLVMRFEASTEKRLAEIRLVVEEKITELSK